MRLGPHDIYSVVEELPDGRLLVELAHPRVLVVLRDDARRRRGPDTPEQRATSLFLSLLDQAQRNQWLATGRCWVETPRGLIRLGRLHDLRLRPREWPDEEWSLCVVPRGPALPADDVWTNLLLVLAADPDEFFRVAASRKTRLPLSWPPPP